MWKHSNLNLNNLQCIACKRIFKSISGLKNHQRACKLFDNNTNKIVQPPPPALATKNTVPNTNEQAQIPIVTDDQRDNLIDDNFRKSIHDAYTKMSVWRRNLFQLPKGSIGKNFIIELTATLELWNNNSPYRDIALKMFMLLPSLLLQRTNPKSKTLENKQTLERRLALWRDRKIEELVGECLVFQSRLSAQNNTKNISTNELFQKHMLRGNIKGVLLQRYQRYYFQ